MNNNNNNNNKRKKSFSLLFVCDIRPVLWRHAPSTDRVRVKRVLIGCRCLFFGLFLFFHWTPPRTTLLWLRTNVNYPFLRIFLLDATEKDVAMVTNVNYPFLRAFLLDATEKDVAMVTNVN